MTAQGKSRLKKFVAIMAFGSFDGLCSCLGIIIMGFLLPVHVVFLLIIGSATGSALSMAGGEYISDNESGWKEASAMGLATAMGHMTPIIPFLLFPKTIAAVVAGAFSLGYSLVIARIRGHKISNYCYAVALLISIIGTTVTFAKYFGEK